MTRPRWPMTAAERLAYYGVEVRAVQAPTSSSGASCWRSRRSRPALSAGRCRCAADRLMGGVAHHRHPPAAPDLPPPPPNCSSARRWGMWSFTIRYAQGLMSPGWTNAPPPMRCSSRCCWSLRRHRRVLARVRPATILALFAGVAVVLTVAAATVGGRWGLYALVGCFFMSIQFPTIFALRVEAGAAAPCRCIVASWRSSARC